MKSCHLYNRDRLRDYYANLSQIEKDKHYTGSNGSKGKETLQSPWGNQEEFIQVMMLDLRMKVE